QLLPLLVEYDALKLPGPRYLAFAQAADEHAALPPGEDVAGVERHPGDRDRRYPEDQRRFRALERRVRRDDLPGIGASVADERPTVVRAGLQHINLVAAIRALLGDPKLTGPRVRHDAVAVAMPERVDRRQVALV